MLTLETQMVHFQLYLQVKAITISQQEVLVMTQLSELLETTPYSEAQDMTTSKLIRVITAFLETKEMILSQVQGKLEEPQKYMEDLATIQ